MADEELKPRLLGWRFAKESGSLVSRLGLPERIEVARIRVRTQMQAMSQMSSTSGASAPVKPVLGLLQRPASSEPPIPLFMRKSQLVDEGRVRPAPRKVRRM